MLKFRCTMTIFIMTETETIRLYCTRWNSLFTPSLENRRHDDSHHDETDLESLIFDEFILPYIYIYLYIYIYIYIYIENQVKDNQIWSLLHLNCTRPQYFIWQQSVIPDRFVLDTDRRQSMLCLWKKECLTLREWRKNIAVIPMSRNANLTGSYSNQISRQIILNYSLTSGIHVVNMKMLSCLQDLIVSSW